MENEVYIRMDIHTTGDDINLKKNCSDRPYKQLGNKHMVQNVYIGPKGMCKNQINKKWVKLNWTIQDYIPRNYAFSFGCPCTSKKTYFLKGLTFNINIIEQKNETKCYIIPKSNKFCQYYSKTTVPNLLGDLNILNAPKVIGAYMLFKNPLGLNGMCHKHIVESACCVLLPKCEPDTQQVTHLCREACYELKETCFNVSLLQAGLKTFKGYNLYNATQMRDMASSPEFHNLFDCSYLPSKNDTIPCFYKPVTCENPPNVTDAIISTKSTNEPYSPYSRIEYSCKDDSFILQGNDTIKCLYNGQWSQEPRCTLKPDSQPWKSMVTAISLGFIVVAIITVVLVTKICRKESQLLTRQKKYDAFVCYSYRENDGEFTENTIRIHLEEQRPFKLCIHRRDFLAAWDIKWNIMNAIRNSNSAIIVMSQDYVKSLWCKKEFEDCYLENMKDPAFKMFVIMMQPMETLNNSNEYIKSFLDRKTYLERDDPKLFKKIANYLAWVKRAKGNEEIPVERRELLCDDDDQNIRQKEELFPEYGIEEHTEVNDNGTNGYNNDNEEEYNVNNDDNHDHNYVVNNDEYHKAK